MSARILDGRSYVAAISHELAELARERAKALGGPALLAIVAMRDADAARSASDVYSRQLRRTARSLGMTSHAVHLPLRASTADLLAELDRLNEDPQVQGILVQLPLPSHIGRDALLDAIVPEKDVDGISATNAGNLFLSLPANVPATCAAVIELLDRAAIPVAGRRIVVVGASPVVGRPLAMQLLRRDATVTICHEFTRDLPAFTRQAEVLIVAVGRPGLITAGMVLPGAIVIDVGINVLPDGSVTGDVAFDEVARVAGAITPVPGGVGPLTALMVMRQTLRHFGDDLT
jgi:methylenetetrahydrofolate dehydrogenase (NADP+)/methenyltetrahydrofolate cyclohydrolase